MLWAFSCGLYVASVVVVLRLLVVLFFGFVVSYGFGRFFFGVFTLFFSVCVD